LRNDLQACNGSFIVDKNDARSDAGAKLIEEGVVYRKAAGLMLRIVWSERL